MRTILCNLSVFDETGFLQGDLAIEDGIITAVASRIVPLPEDRVISFPGCYVFPGFADVHVHLREPGFSYKETIRTGTLAAARGGYTTVCAMPNLNPVPDSKANLAPQLDLIRSGACVRVVPYGSITAGEKGERLSQLADLAPFVAGFSDDGRGVASAELMEAAMVQAKALNRLIVAHCEDMRYAPEDPRSEYEQVARDLELVQKTGCRYHVCHVSSRQSLALIRQAKAAGLDVSCETAPHYLLLHRGMVKDDGRFKMNPPLREEADRQALREGIADGTVDMIATDHAPHSAEEKSKGFAGSLNGITGLECAFSALYTDLVRWKQLSLMQLIRLLSVNPGKRFGFGGGLYPGAPADLTVFDLDENFILDPDSFVSMGKSTPFAGRRLFGKCRMTVCGGRIVYNA